MKTLAVLTPSYAPDYELCRDLNRSVLEWTLPSTEHHIVVPRSDRERFGTLTGPRTRVWTVEEFLPNRIKAIPFANFWVNLRRPYPPVRGWIMQQLIKLQASAQLDADLVLLVDSDIVLVRPVTATTFVRDGSVALYQSIGAVHAGMRQHVVWHDVARRLLGLPPTSPPPLPDYIGGFIVWERRVLRDLRERIETVTGRPWLDAIASQVHFSEFILYGVFVDTILAGRGVVPTDSMLCHNYYPTAPLSASAADAFLDACGPDDVAIMINAKSTTALDVRRAALAAFGRSLAAAGD